VIDISDSGLDLERAMNGDLNELQQKDIRGNLGASF